MSPRPVTATIAAAPSAATAIEIAAAPNGLPMARGEDGVHQRLERHDDAEEDRDQKVVQRSPWRPSSLAEGHHGRLCAQMSNGRCAS